MPAPVSSATAYPQSFSFVNADGVRIHGIMILPPGFDGSAGRRYPCLLSVYAGPHAQVRVCYLRHRLTTQLATNTYKSHRMALAGYAAAELGWVTVCIDSRGSWNRGLAFEGCLKGRLGARELEDQIDGLLYLARGRPRGVGESEDLNEVWKGVLAAGDGCIDPNRVVIRGWSYGGYMSLMALARYPGIFSAAIPGTCRATLTLSIYRCACNGLGAV